MYKLKNNRLSGYKMSAAVLELVNFEPERLVSPGGWCSGPNDSRYIEFKYNVGDDGKEKLVSPSFKFPKVTTTAKGIFKSEKNFGDKIQTYYSAQIHFDMSNETHALAVEKLKQLHYRICQIMSKNPEEVNIQKVVKMGKGKPDIVKDEEALINEISETVLKPGKVIYIPTIEGSEEPDTSKAPSCFITFKYIPKNKNGNETVSMLTNIADGSKQPFTEFMDIKLDFIPLVSYSRFTRAARMSFNATCFAGLITKFYEKAEGAGIMAEDYEKIKSGMTEEEIEQAVAAYKKLLLSKSALPNPSSPPKSTESEGDTAFPYRDPTKMDQPDFSDPPAYDE